MPEQVLEVSESKKVTARSLHTLGVLTGFAAGVWMGAAEAPTKFVAAGFSPVLLSLAMVSGVFTGRWTVPTLLKGTGYVFQDLREKKHLIIWALLGGALWAVANTLGTVAVREVGLSIAFPLWNTDRSAVGLVLFLRAARGKQSGVDESSGWKPGDYSGRGVPRIRIVSARDLHIAQRD
jgi:hypothetical protein